MDIHDIIDFQPRVDLSSADDSAHFPLDGQDLQTVSDEALIALYNTAPIIYELGGNKIVRLSKALALRGGVSVLLCEARNINFTATNTQIPMPRVHRVLHVEAGDGFWGAKCFILTDYIQGTCLLACWADLDAALRSSVTSQVAAMIQDMESITLEVPGPIGGKNRCRGVCFSEYGAGPFYTLQDLESWFNHKLDICERYKQAIKGTPTFRFHKLVLTHQDITPRNLILDKSGRVWLIDWAHAGAYPPGFERAALEH